MVRHEARSSQLPIRTTRWGCDMALSRRQFVGAAAGTAALAATGTATAQEEPDYVAGSTTFDYDGIVDSEARTP